MKKSLRDRLPPRCVAVWVEFPAGKRICIGPGWISDQLPDIGESVDLHDPPVDLFVAQRFWLDADNLLLLGVYVVAGEPPTRQQREIIEAAQERRLRLLELAA